MLKVALLDANGKTNVAYEGLAMSVVAGWLRWEAQRANIPLVDPLEADIVFLIYSGSIDWLDFCTRTLKRVGLEPHTRKRMRRPYVVAGGACDSIPFTALTLADAVSVGEGYTLVRELLTMAGGQATLDDIAQWLTEFPHAIERSQVEQLKRDERQPWLLAEPAPMLASPDPYVDWDVPPIRSDDRVVRILAEKGCHGKCAFCATTFRQVHRQNPNERRVLGQLTSLKARGERVQLLSNDPMNLPYFRRMPVRLDSQSFTILEVSDPANRAAIIRSGVGMARFGVEGLSERIRKAFAKPVANNTLFAILDELNTAGLTTHIFLIVGAPGEGQADWDEFRVFYRGLTRAVTKGICRLKFTTFVPGPPAPLARFIPDTTYDRQMDALGDWVAGNAASRHLLRISGRKPKLHIRNVAEQLSVTRNVAEQLVMTDGSWDLHPTLEIARRAPWEVVAWPLPVETRYKIASVYARRMGMAGNTNGR